MSLPLGQWRLDHHVSIYKAQRLALCAWRTRKVWTKARQGGHSRWRTKPGLSSAVKARAFLIRTSRRVAIEHHHKEERGNCGKKGKALVFMVFIKLSPRRRWRGRGTPHPTRSPRTASRVHDAHDQLDDCRTVVADLARRRRAWRRRGGQIRITAAVSRKLPGTFRQPLVMLTMQSGQIDSWTSDYLSWSVLNGADITAGVENTTTIRKFQHNVKVSALQPRN